MEKEFRPSVGFSRVDPHFIVAFHCASPLEPEDDENGSFSMKKQSLTKAMAAVGIRAALAITASVPAHAITRPDCGTRTDFLKFHTGNHCYANSGTATDRLTSQQTVGAGHNGGFFTLSVGGDVPFEPGWGTSFAKPQTVIVEHID